MNAAFYIVDDDKPVRKMLERIITDHDLGNVIGQSEDGTEALAEIAALSPDIVLVDLLLPGVDGISLVSALKPDCPRSCFVMLSQVADKEMVGKAYQAGVDFFINKPINVIEVVSVISQVRERMNMKKFIHSLRATIDGIEPKGDSPAPTSGEDARRKHIRSVLAKLGILAESGSEDITDMCLHLLSRAGGDGNRKMSELYALIAARYAERGMRINAASVEQRVRRAIYKALNNTANLGLEDYANEFFVAFGSSFFDFTEVRHQMNYLRGTVDVQGKINVKKFIEGLVIHIQDR
ncbi:MAG: Protein-glutamate methylesterase/protein-glutamine glutaminase [Desulfovibrio sp.]